MNNLISYSFIIIIIITIIVSCISSDSLKYSDYVEQDEIYISQSGFAWPIPGFYSISSYFGNRTSPTSFASSYHTGIDIPASENTYFISTIAGRIIYTGFNGSGGYTIILESSNIRVSYCHVSPDFIVNVRRLC